MNDRRNITNLKSVPARIRRFVVRSIVVGTNPWIPTDQHVGKVQIAITFNRAVRRTSLVLKNSVRIDVVNVHTSRKASNILGTFLFYNGDKVAVFVSQKPLSDLAKPDAGEDIQYTITLKGTNPGRTVITDTRGEVLDGDRDGVTGGNFVKAYVIVG